MKYYQQCFKRVSNERRRRPRASSLIEKETLMLFFQPQRHQGTKVTVKFIHSMTIKDLMIDRFHFCYDLEYISSLRVLVPGGKTVSFNLVS